MQHLQPGTTLQGGKYRIEQVLGQGGFGITYLATQVSSNRQVAIKELFIGGSGQAINDRRGDQVVVTNSANQQSFNQQKAKFKKEALRLANLNHPNLVKVHEFFEENGTAYYVMDFIDGESLRTKINREGKLSESLVLKYINQILPALDAAHKQSIWHLDIKPENIMVDRYGHAYMIDFGASKHVERTGTLTTSLALAYTPGYCATELTDLLNESEEGFAEAMREIGPWTDIYSVGATMYNLLTDNIPPSSKRIERNGRNAFTFSSDVSSSTKDLIIWMMKPNREERPQSINEIARRSFCSSCRDGENTIIERKRDTEEKKKKDEEKNRNEAYVLRVQLDENLYDGKYFVLGAIGGALGIIAGIKILGTNDPGLIPGLVVAFISGFLAVWYPVRIYVHFKGKDNIKKWKEQHPNDPRSKYL
jgi:serine/threonine protein kinase